MLNLNLLKNSIVLVRVNYDLPAITETDRIKDSLQTIKILLSNQNKVVLTTHWGRPQGKVVNSLSTKLILSPLYEAFKESDQEILNKAHVEYLNQFQSFADASKYMKNYPSSNEAPVVFLLENTRFQPMEQSKNSKDRLDVARQYATLADNFVDEAFAVSHRNEATNCEIKSLLPYVLGYSYESEINHLSKIKDFPLHPLYIVMAGSKLETKLPLISALIEKADKIFLGGMLCFTFIKAFRDLYPGQEVADIYDSPIEESFSEIAKNLLQTYPDKIVLPLDLVTDVVDGKTLAFDVGPKTIEFYTSQIAQAKTIFWNGTLGYYEKPPYDEGTLHLAENVSEMKDAYKVIGGGDTNSAIPHEITKKFDFVSMGGGATLDYLSKPANSK